MDGWLKLHRSLADHWIFSFKEPDKALAWIDLLIMARHTDGTIMLKGRALPIKRGQVGMSQLAMQKRWGWSQNKVKRFLKLLERHGMADFETNDLTTLITICNFESFQGDGRADERPDGRADERPVERTANDQSNDDIRKKESLESKNEKKTPLPAAAAKPSDDVYQIFTYWRDVMKKNSSAKCTPKRSKAVKGRLAEGYSVDDIKAAVFGCSVTPHNMGQQSSTNPAGKRFDCLELICRNGENVERFKSNGESISPAEQKQAEIDDWIAGTEQPPMTDYSAGETIDHESF